MESYEIALSEVGLHIPTILLPSAKVPLETWAVVACDQFTSEPEYWQEVERKVQPVPSTYHIILPEAYLEAPDKIQRIVNINRTMQQYLDESILEPSLKGFILVRRTMLTGKVRTGLVVAIDLDEYDFHSGSKSLVRASEKTVIERIPPRVQIRENAPIESPHILVLIDDPLKKVIEPIYETLLRQNIQPLYDTELMMRGGKVAGYSVTDPTLLNTVALSLKQIKKADGFLYAMGDGNHSLATAKACWDQLKGSLSEEQKQTHSAKYALVELNNIHDQGMDFEPIHRILFDVDKQDLLSYLQGNGAEVTLVQGNQTETIRLQERNSHLTVGVLQILLDEYLTSHPKAKIDYIHGEASLRKLSTEENSIGFLLEGMDKSELFPTISMDGALPRKTFSMGEAEEKRYYMECRRIR
jgi:uncharacterized protein (DUF1015 family)